MKSAYLGQLGSTFVLLLLAGCAAGAQTPPTSPASSPAPAVTPTAVPTATPTPTPSPTATPFPVTTAVQTTTPAGVGYTVITAAPAGARVAKFGDMATVDYTGWLVNGTQFDSSIGHSPFVFKIGSAQAIEGWNLGITGMAVGETRKLVLTPDLAYGDDGQGTKIPPDATLIFEVKLLSIQ